MQTLFNKFYDLFDSVVDEHITIDEWFNLIRKSSHSENIVDARLFAKGQPMANKAKYDRAKNKVPTITYNFKFHTSRANDNIIADEPTGLLYLDVDDLTFDINTLDKSKIFSYYKSFGGSTGYAILVRVDGLTIDNYEPTYASICNDLGITFVFDKCAKKKTQPNVLSYDPDIFINYDSFVFSATDVIDSLTTFSDFVPHPEVIKKKETYTHGGDQPLIINESSIRFNNLNEIKVDGDYAVNWDGWEYVRCWLPFNNKVQEGKRNSSLLSYCNNLVWLNPHLTITGAETILYRVNNQMCEVPVDATQIKGIVKSIFKQKETGNLKPIYNRKPRKILFAAYSELTPEQKFRLCGELMNDKKRNDSLQKINDIIEVWDFAYNGKITVRAVARIAKMSKKTVVKYWSEFKEHVAKLNNSRGQVKALQEATAQLKETDDTLLSASPEMQPEALNEAVEVAYNFNDAGFNLAGINMLMNAVESLPDDELIKLVVGIEDAYHNKPTGEVSVAAGGLTYKFINDVTASTVSFNGFN